MQKESKRKVLRVTAWFLAAACMVIIFWFSSRTADESSMQSSLILRILTAVFGDNGFTDFIVRKTAHFLEFTGLCFFFNFAFYVTQDKPAYYLSGALTSLYAATDEVHQIFVEGRSCQVTDWLIDTGGAILGSLAFFIILLLIRATKSHRQKSH